MVLSIRIGILVILMAANNTVLAIEEIIVIGKSGLTMAQQMELAEYRQQLLNNHNVGIVEELIEGLTFLGLIKLIQQIAIPRDQEDFHDACNLTVPTSASGEEAREQIVLAGVSQAQGTWGESDTQILRVNFANGYRNYFIEEVVIANALQVSEQDFTSGNTNCGNDV